MRALLRPALLLEIRISLSMPDCAIRAIGHCHWLGDIYVQDTAIQLSIVHVEDSFSGILGIFIFDKSKATVLSSSVIQRYVDINKLLKISV